MSVSGGLLVRLVKHLDKTVDFFNEALVIVGSQEPSSFNKITIHEYTFLGDTSVVFHCGFRLRAVNSLHHIVEAPWVNQSHCFRHGGVVSYELDRRIKVTSSLVALEFTTLNSIYELFIDPRRVWSLSPCKGITHLE